MIRFARLATAGAATVIAIPLALSSSADAQQAPGKTSELSVFHAIPNIVVDVYANGEVLLTDFEQGALTDPVTLPQGDYDLKLVNAGDGAEGAAVVSADDFPVRAGENLTLVAHLSSDGEAIITPYVNNNTDIAAGDARLTVRHIAAAPRLDVRADGKVLFSDLANPGQAEADVPAGMLSADVVRAGRSKVKIGPEDVELEEGVNTILYAWGSAEDGDLSFAVQKIAGIESAPNAVPGGTGGQAATQPAMRVTTRRAH